jgi:hypothetical protein
MFIRTKASPNSPRKTVQIVESVRHGKAVSQRILQHIGVASDETELEQLILLAGQILEKLNTEKQNALQQQLSLPLELSASYEKPVDDYVTVKLASLENEEHVIDGPMEVAEYLHRFMGFDKIFTDANRDMGKITLLKRCLSAMLVHPSSKRGMSAWLAEHCATDVSLDRIYRFMDALFTREKKVKELIRAQSEGLFMERPSLLLFDVTTLYFESFKSDELRQPGFSKDNKVKETQIVLALATTPDGMPLWYEVFPGNTWEGETLRHFTCNWRNSEYQDSSGVLVADSAMLASINLEELRKQGLNYVLGARLKKLKALEKEQVLDLSGYAEIKDKEGETLRYRIIERDNGNRLLVTWSAARAKKDEADRQRLVERLSKKLSGKKRQSLKGKAVISNRGTHRYLKISEGETENSYVLDDEKIELDAKWDGLHGLETDLSLSSESEICEALSHYHSLWRIEESFRIQKSHLQIRPVYHYTKERIHAHIALCYMAFASLRHLEKRIYLQQKERMSPEAIRAAILDVRSALLRDKATGKLYRFPKRLCTGANKLYKSLGLKRDTKPREITSQSAYRHRNQSAEKEETNE